MSTNLWRFAAGGAVAGYLALAVAAGAQTQATTTPQKEMRRAAVEEMHAKLEAARKETADKIKTARGEFQKKLAQIKDEKKKQVADSLYNRLGTLNEQWTAHFTDVLDRLDEVSKKIESRRDKAQAAGNMPADGVVAINAALEVASTAIASARTAVEVQTKKTYTVAVTTDIKLRAAFQAAHEALKKDLMGLRDGAMKNAREAVQKAVQVLRGVPAVDKDDKTSPQSAGNSSSSK